MYSWYLLIICCYMRKKKRRNITKPHTNLKTNIFIVYRFWRNKCHFKTINQQFFFSFGINWFVIFCFWFFKIMVKRTRYVYFYKRLKTRMIYLVILFDSFSVILFNCTVLVGVFVNSIKTKIRWKPFTLPRGDKVLCTQHAIITNQTIYCFRR